MATNSCIPRKRAGFESWSTAMLSADRRNRTYIHGTIMCVLTKILQILVPFRATDPVIRSYIYNLHGNVSTLEILLTPNSVVDCVISMYHSAILRFPMSFIESLSNLQNLCAAKRYLVWSYISSRRTRRSYEECTESVECRASAFQSVGWGIDCRTEMSRITEFGNPNTFDFDKYQKYKLVRMRKIMINTSRQQKPNLVTINTCDLTWQHPRYLSLDIYLSNHHKNPPTKMSEEFSTIISNSSLITAVGRSILASKFRWKKPWLRK